MTQTNFLLNTDSYKHSQWLQYPPGTEYVYSYIESRGGEYPHSLFFGLQMFIKKYLTKPITISDIVEAQIVCKAHGVPFNGDGWMYILKEHGGKLPLLIKAVPEGSVLPVGLPLVTIVNTDPKCYWLTSFAETAILRGVWYPTTVATKSMEIRKVIKRYLEQTGDVSGLDFKLHDFGARGVSSEESAEVGGLAHLATGFKGTDTMSALLGAYKYYGEEMAGFSIPASEHSTITSWGKEREFDAYRNMIKLFGGDGKIYACVSDSFDVFNATRNGWGGVLKDEVIAAGGTLVIRPDSGEIVPTILKLANIIDEKFGSTINAKGYKVFNNVRLIQGDGIDGHTIVDEILWELSDWGFSADNIAFGSGGGMLQKLNRDTMKFAMKCSAAKINGEWVDVYKDPITDLGKRSKRGRIETVRMWTTDGKLVVHDLSKPLEGGDYMMQTVFENGRLLVDQSLMQIRSLVASQI